MNFYDILLARCLRCNRPYPKSASGSIITITDGAGNMPLLGAVVNIEPVQSGSGDPSPTNIRPISGWTQVNVMRAGKNLFDKSATDTNNGYVENKYVNGRGALVADSDCNISEYISIKAEQTYTVYGVSGSNIGFAFYDGSKVLISALTYSITWGTIGSKTFTTPKNCAFIRLSIIKANVNITQLELGSTATAYEPYRGTPIPIPLGQTVYGGTLDVVRGKLAIDRAIVDLGNLAWGKSPNGNKFYATLPQYLKDRPNENYICTRYKFDGFVSSSPYYGENGTFRLFRAGGASAAVYEIYIHDDNYNDAATFKSAMSEVQLLYPATPIEVGLTPQTIKTLLGTNNIWADAGDTSVEYVAVSCCKSGSEEEPLEVTENGQYIAPEGKAFNPVTVSVPLPSGSLSITENGIYNVYSYASVDVDVAGGISVDDIAMRKISGAIVGSSAPWIGSYAFAYCYSLAEVSFPSCITIGTNAFYNCSSLTEANFPACTSIGSYAFAYCSSLTGVSFPVCTSVGTSAFYSCSSLTEVSFPACTSVGVSAFAYCSSLAEVSFPSCITIGTNAFGDCSSLTEANFPVCTSIGSYAFYRCSSLTGVSFPVCRSIGSYAFRDCSSLAEVSFPACTSIGSSAFCSCSSLTKASFPTCMYIGGSAFYSCRSLTEVSFPACMHIEQYTFDACYSLTEVSFPACTNIGNYAFGYCHSLTKASFPACTIIRAYAFAYCSSLTEVSFPACTSIENNTFRNCYNLLSFNLVGVSSVPTLGGSSVFYSTPIGGYTGSTGGVYGSVYVPSSLLTAFQTAPNWSLISSRIVGV